MRQVLRRDAGERRQVIGLVLGGAEPDHLRVFDDGVEHHQSLDRVVQRERSPELAVCLADGRVERPLVDVVDARAVVTAVVHRGVLKSDELGEELPRLRTVDDAAEARVLAWDADAGVQHHGRQESRLALGEALLGDDMDAFVEGHRSSSSMMLGVRPPLRPPPPLRAREVEREAGTGLRRGVRASIVRRHDLDVERVVAAVDVVLDPDVGELHVPLVVTRQVVLARPALDLQRVAVGPAVAVVAVAVPLLQELLVLGLQLVLQDDAVDVCVHVVQAFGFFEVRTVDLGVVLQLSRLLDTVS